MGALGQEGRAKMFGELIAWVAGGALKADVEATYPLERVKDALSHAAKGERSGKIFLTLK
jgi:NADPH:quinone reductase-like Zn-dependent oxidoreductase